MKKKLEARAATKKCKTKYVRLNKVSEVMFGSPIVLEFILVVIIGGQYKYWLVPFRILERSRIVVVFLEKVTF